MPIDTEKQQHEFEPYRKNKMVCGRFIDAYARCSYPATADVHNVHNVPAPVPAERVEEHSPLPWKWFTNYHCAGPLKGAYIDSINARVADVLSMGVGSQKICEANAELICRAVNSYSANQAERKVAGQLAKALQMHMQWIGPAPTDAHSYDSLREDAWKLGIKALAAFNQLREGGE